MTLVEEVVQDVDELVISSVQEVEVEDEMLEVVSEQLVLVVVGETVDEQLSEVEVDNVMVDEQLSDVVIGDTILDEEEIVDEVIGSELIGAELETDEVVGVIVEFFEQ